VTINNLASRNASVDAWVLSNMTVAITSPALTTVQPGSFKRLRAGDQIIVSVGVQNAAGTAAGTAASATVTITDANGQAVQVARADEQWAVTAGIPAWDNTDPSLSTHEAADWFDDAKFGIFIHWVCGRSVEFVVVATDVASGCLQRPRMGAFWTAIR
jgi:alpha-L-fucosidase